MKILHGSRVTQLSVPIANTFKTKLFGLMGRRAGDNSGLYIQGTNQIHTHFMRFPLDVFYINEDGTVIALERAMKPWRIGRVVRGAKAVLEMEVGHGYEIGVGDKVVL